MDNFNDLDHESAVLVADLLYATESLSAYIQQALVDEDPEGSKKLQADLMAGNIEIVWFLSAESIKLMAVSKDREAPDLKIFELDLTGNDTEGTHGDALPALH